MIARTAHRWELMRSSPAFWAAAVAVTLAITYLIWTPLVPDLAAQVARSNLVRDAGNVGWWTGWFGGISMPNYSLFAPATMALIGVRIIAVIAAVLGSIAFARLVQGAARPRAGAVAFALATVADVIDGRVTFAIGVAAGAWALVAVVARRSVLAVLLAIATYAASPLAGLFLGMTLLVAAFVDASRRRPALAAAGATALAGGLSALLLPGFGTMPTRATDILPATGCCLVVAVACRNNKAILYGVAATVASMAAFVVIPLSVGANATRLVWLCAVPVVVALGRLDRRRMVVAVILLACWPMYDLAKQLSAAKEPSATETFYEPLAAAITQQQASAPIGQRVEVIDTANHWASVYLAARVPLARGWDRQADHANNPIFYDRDQLTVASYREWLDQLAVGWVALPHGVSVDYASRGEEALVAGGLPYLTPVWSNSEWTLYAVRDPAPLAQNAVVTAVHPSTVSLQVAHPGVVTVQVRWSPYLTVRRADGSTTAACVAPRADFTQVWLPSAGTYVLGARFDVAARLRSVPAPCQGLAD